MKAKNKEKDILKMKAVISFLSFCKFFKAS